jgi:hypothetical protein
VGRVAEWRAAGLTWSQIAARLRRSETAVRKRFQRIRGASPKKMPKQSAGPPKQIEKVPADVIADRDARAQARFGSSNPT